MFQCWIFAIPETDCVFAQNCLECNTLQNLWSCITTNRGTCRQHRTTPRLNNNPARAIVLIKIFDTSCSTNCCRYKLRTDSAQVFRKSHLHNSIRFCWTRWEFHDNKKCLWGHKNKSVHVQVVIVNKFRYRLRTCKCLCATCCLFVAFVWLDVFGTTNGWQRVLFYHKVYSLFPNNVSM